MLAKADDLPKALDWADPLAGALELRCMLAKRWTPTTKKILSQFLCLVSRRHMQGTLLTRPMDHALLQAFLVLPQAYTLWIRSNVKVLVHYFATMTQPCRRLALTCLMQAAALDTVHAKSILRRLCAQYTCFATECRAIAMGSQGSKAQ